MYRRKKVKKHVFQHMINKYLLQTRSSGSLSPILFVSSVSWLCIVQTLFFFLNCFLRLLCLLFSTTCFQPLPVTFTSKKTLIHFRGMATKPQIAASSVMWIWTVLFFWSLCTTWFSLARRSQLLPGFLAAAANNDLWFLHYNTAANNELWTFFYYYLGDLQ
jgi:hypothetical protein